MDLDLMDVLEVEDAFIFSFANPATPSSRSETSVRIDKDTCTLGIDVQGYSNLNLSDQFLTSVKITAVIERTVSWIEKNAPSASHRPDAIVPTGDGAYLFFGTEGLSLNHALNFMTILALNITTYNQQIPRMGATYNGQYIPVRFALATGRSLHMKDPNGNTNVVGESIISCSRILSCDHGTHFVISEHAAALLRKSGHDLATGIRIALSPILAHLNLSISSTLQRTCKEQVFKYLNILLEYDLADLLDQYHAKRQPDRGRHVITIGDSSLKGLDTD